AHKPLKLGPSDLLVLPVRQGSCLVAALVVGGFFPGAAAASGLLAHRPAAASVTAATATAARASAATAARENADCRSFASGFGSGSGADLQLDPAHLTDLTRLAQILAFGIFGSDPNHARYLSTVADHLGLLPLRQQSLSGLVGGVLQAVSELLHQRFSLQLQPVLALAHGHGGGHAVFFTQRGGAGVGPAPSAGMTSMQRDLLLETHTSVQSLSALAASSADPRSTMPYQMGSVASGPAEQNGLSMTDAACPAAVKAVRITLANTLLGEALRVQMSASMLGVEGPMNSTAKE
ncbi:hypothetical protein Vretifemale_10250, partial [Volvox reticuliferus]